LAIGLVLTILSASATLVLDTPELKAAYDEGYIDGYTAGYLVGQADCLDDPASCDITFASLMQSADLGETEPNNSGVTADPLPVGKTIGGQTQSPTDLDWFRLTTPSKNALLTVSFVVNNPAVFDSWQIAVKDRSGNTVSRYSTWDTMVVSETDAQVTVNVTVGEPGTYYVVVAPTTYDRSDFVPHGSTNDDSGFPYLLHVTLTETSQDSPSNPGIGAYDAEIEPNGSWSSANPLASSVSIVGQLYSANDEDWFILSTNGDEILSFDFCKAGCSGYWTVFVIDGDVDKFVLDHGIEGNPAIGQAPINAIEYLSDRGALDDSVLATLAIQQEQTLDIGIRNPGIYYFVVAPVWKREDGALNRVVVQKEETAIVVITPEKKVCPSGSQDVNGVCTVPPRVCEGGTVTADNVCNNAKSIVCNPGTTPEIIANGGTQENPLVTGYCSVPPVIIPEVKKEVVTQPEVLGGLVADPFSTDQYTFSVRRTAWSPSTEDSPEYDAYQLRATYDSASSKLHIPQVSIGDRVYSADLLYIPGGPSMNFRLQSIVPVQ